MNEFPGDLLPYPSYLPSSLPHLHERVIRDPSKPSGVRVLGRSMFVIAAGWLLAAGWLGLNGWLQTGTLMPLSATTLAAVIGPALAMTLVGCLFARCVGRAPYRELEWREWRHAIWWSIVPNTLLLSTAWMLIVNTEL